ncbi:L,D-transpeptidase family protein [Flavobacterium sp.]|uniref:L,D-transpeptidase family protein n=1 Tax=Flavobacterium sp. TaxID=239 RepID=UPI00286D5EB9|nr:L,D-transpeptidase family protein [Flavobacterium sp.]
MKNSVRFTIMLFGFSIFFISCKKKEAQPTNENLEASTETGKTTFDSIAVTSFFEKYPKLKTYEPQVRALYRKHQWHYIWYDDKGVTELADLLYSKLSTIEDEGVKTKIPYKKSLEVVFQNDAASKANAGKECLISALYFFYADKVFHGLDAKTTAELGWYLPRKKQSYVNYLDSLIAKPSLMNDEKEVLGQYYRLKSILKLYREAEKKTVWDSIAYDPNMDPIVVGDSTEMVSKIRTRLFALGNLKTDSKSNVYDKSMAEQVILYKTSMGLTPTSRISGKMITEMNVSLDSRIKTIMINMERCRWIPTDITKAKEYIVINIPSYKLTYFKDGKPALRSNVVVGKVMHQTVVFSGMMKFIVFSPYWNVPKSIIEKEIKPEIEKNKNYLEQHDMEWNKGQIRQKPGPKNSLGLVKFLFPNSNNIYLHDSPAKSLFDRSSRAFSHGCIRVAKPAELAKAILEDDKNWTPEKVDEAMHSGEESWYTLRHKIPVYIGYFTAWVDDENLIHFYEDVYKRDGRLGELIFKE